MFTRLLIANRGEIAIRIAQAAADLGLPSVAAFGDDRVFVEELLAPARHIEVQILGDGTGAVTQLGERDCSIQRRNQKIIEVAPSPGLPENVRSALLAHAVRLGESVRWPNSGWRRATRPLLAKVIVHDRTADFATLAGRAHRALSECHVAGVDTNLDLLAAIVGHPAFARGEFTTGFLDEHLDELLADQRPRRFVQLDPASAAEDAGREFDVPDDASAVRASAPGTVIAVQVSPGDDVRAGATLIAVEAMKMEHLVTAPSSGTIRQLAVSVGDTVATGDVLVLLDPAPGSDDGPLEVAEIDPDTIRPDLAEALERHAIGLDASRGGAVAKRHGTGPRTARENLADLCDAGSFVEYGALAIAAQRQRRSLEDLVERTQADGMLAGTATVNADLVGADRARVVVLSYDYTVLAGTQGATNHKKKDRLFTLAAERRLPVAVYAEGGGGRPGDTDGSWVSMLDVPAFELFAKLSALVPLVGVVAGRCFAGNAALAGICDVIIAVEGASLGMSGPAMIEGRGHQGSPAIPLVLPGPRRLVDRARPAEAAPRRPRQSQAGLRHARRHRGSGRRRFGARATPRLRRRDDHRADQDGRTSDGPDRQ